MHIIDGYEVMNGYLTTLVSQNGRKIEYPLRACL